jgi:hypothetical protein
MKNQENFVKVMGPESSIMYWFVEALQSNLAKLIIDQLKENC